MLKEFNNLIQLTEYFKTEKECQDHFALIRWGDKPCCPHCESKKVYKLATGSYKCVSCDRIFSVRVGTIFENSKLSLKKWFIAIFLLSTTKKGISSIQLSKEIGVTQKTAWYIMHRIREAIAQTDEMLNGVVEVDETYIGGKEKNKHAKKRLKHGRGTVGKTAVLGMVERGGSVKAFHIPNTKADTLEKHISDNVNKGSLVLTDEHKGYSRLDYAHNVVSHSKGEYVRGSVHTNTIEGFWATIKRSIIGIYHTVSTKHIDKYLSEWTYRYNFRKIPPCHILHNILYKCVGKRLMYVELIGEKSEGARKDQD